MTKCRLVRELVARLEPGEKPRWTPKRVSILEGDELARFLAAAGAQRPLFEFLAYTGLRIGEALGLTWADIDHEAGLIRVHPQLSRHRPRAAQDPGQQTRGHPRARDREASARALARVVV